MRRKSLRGQTHTIQSGRKRRMSIKESVVGRSGGGGGATSLTMMNLNPANLMGKSLSQGSRDEMTRMRRKRPKVGLGQVRWSGGRWGFNGCSSQQSVVN
ncbi:hypothetical protein ZEAMMB73_Zm00001d017010 [Zea mays]|uniref:Uncharacterized protein n=1 Tax=Zea mays TaxID=4577 RepID=A0A1D6HBP9_MAIZE|nr:hypothetical protein ZEAMMB73_Zm00001d017010 [Zea mays]